MSMTDLNQKAGGLSLGHNQPPVETTDWGALTAERLKADYQAQTDLAEQLKAEEEALPPEILSDEAAINAGAIIKRARELDAILEDKRVVEGTPSYRIKQACDGFFTSIRKSLVAPTPKERMMTPGLADRIQTKISAWQAKKEAAHRAELKRQEEEARKIREAAEKEARDRQAEADRLAREAQEKLAAAQRARNAENIERKNNEAIELAQQATAAAAAAAKAVTEASQATEKAHDARIAGLAPAKDIVRTTGTADGGGGVTLTKATEKYAFLVAREELTDEAKLKLFDHFNDAEVEKAIRGFAVQTRYLQSLPGCSIGTRKKDVTR